MSTLRLSVVSFGLRVALLLVVVLNALVLARTLGPLEFGKYFLPVRLVSVLAALAERGAAWALSLAQILGAVVYLVIYLRVTRAPLAQLARLHDKDVLMLREQVGATLRWKESRG